MFYRSVKLKRHDEKNGTTSEFVISIGDDVSLVRKVNTKLVKVVRVFRIWEEIGPKKTIVMFHGRKYLNMAQTVLGSEVARYPLVIFHLALVIDRLIHLFYLLSKRDSPELFVSSKCVTRSVAWINAPAKVLRLNPKLIGVGEADEAAKQVKQTGEWFCRRFCDHRGFFLDPPKYIADCLC